MAEKKKQERIVQLKSGPQADRNAVLDQREMTFTESPVNSFLFHMSVCSRFSLSGL